MNGAEKGMRRKKKLSATHKNKRAMKRPKHKPKPCRRRKKKRP